MTLLDANILLYAYNPGSPEHASCSRWLENALSGREPVGLAWAVILAFARLATNPRLFRAPLTIDEACAAIQGWLSQPLLQILEPTDRHWAILSGLLVSSQVRGTLVMDADLAALAIEHGATLVTTDRDFTRFNGLKLLNPLAPR